MEFPRTALNIQRGLTVLMLAVVLGVAVVEHRSPLSIRARNAQTWVFWLSAHTSSSADAPSFHLGIYDSVHPSLILIRIPRTTKLQGKLTVARAYTRALHDTGDVAAAERVVFDLLQNMISALPLEPISWEGAGRLSLELETDEADDEPAVAAAQALKARGRSPRALLALTRRALSGLLKGNAAAADSLLLTLDLRRTPRENLQPAVLPSDAAAPGYLARAFVSQLNMINDDKATVIEVLNGTDIQGLAAQAAKVLRSKGVDVMALGQAPRPRSRTVVYDRIGDFERAARVRAALGCPTAITATRIDDQRGVDASVELGGDCTF